MKPTRAVAPSLIAALLAVPALAQQQVDKETLIERRAEKLAKPVFKKAAWTTDYDAAKKQAKDEDKLILAYFTRSYAG